MAAYSWASPKCPARVKVRRTQCEYLSSALHLNSDIARCSRYFAFVPIGDIRNARGRQLRRPIFGPAFRRMPRALAIPRPPGATLPHPADCRPALHSLALLRPAFGIGQHHRAWRLSSPNWCRPHVAPGLCKRQGDFAREPLVAPIKTHLSLELACDYVFHNAPAEPAVRGRRDGRPA